MKFSSKKEEKQLTYYEKGIPKYMITKVLQTGAYRLYKYEGKEIVFIRTRKTDPLFKEVKPVN